ncbi:MAG TPA: 6-carboxytetrahydropterin synthase [Tepidiformaceae bacterium]|jgi:6-pyruvoyltetrahydropterin/6-carboxytetrahydropterin synthase|nr:6-carboxytetrahydropterin synthase [Tepidiformaceae bacterium]
MLLRRPRNEVVTAVETPLDPVLRRRLELAPDDLQATVSEGMRYEVAIDSFFGASHAVRPSGERHTHSFRVQATFLCDGLDARGMTVGFREITTLLEAEAKKYSNQFLNDVPPFTVIQASGENLVTVIYRNLEAACRTALADGPRLSAVTLWENPTSYVRVERKVA